jgi:D-glycero-D-manno-heptose 1,7-bisphosphate phosphatase
MKNKCIFLDRDGVLNVDNPDYVYHTDGMFIIKGAKEALQALKNAGFKLIVITNQSGIDKGIYKAQDVLHIHAAMQKEFDNLLDDIYFAPHNKINTASLAAKPGTLMFEKAAYKYNIDFAQSWMVGDKERDIVPAKKLGIRSILVTDHEPHTSADYRKNDLYEAAFEVILK